MPSPRGQPALSFLRSYVFHTINQSCFEWHKCCLLSKRSQSWWCIKRYEDTNIPSLFTKVLRVSSSQLKREEHRTGTQVQWVQKPVSIRQIVSWSLSRNREEHRIWAGIQGYLFKYSSKYSWFRYVLKLRCAIFLLNNSGFLLWAWSFPWINTNFKYLELSMGSIPAGLPTHRGENNTPVLTLCLLSAHLIYLPLVAVMGKTGSTQSPEPTGITGKRFKSGSTSVGNSLSSPASYSSLRDMSSKITGQQLICAISLKKDLGEWFRNKHLWEDWGFFACKVGLSHCFSLTLSSSAMTHANEEHLNSRKKNPSGLSKSAELGEREGKMYLHSHHDSHQSNKQLGFS